MRLLSDLVDADGSIDPDRWEDRARARSPVGRCDCGQPLAGRPAEAPEHSSVTYRDVICPAGHERTIVGRYTGRTLDPPPGVVDITAPRRGTEKEN